MRRIFPFFMMFVLILAACNMPGSEPAPYDPATDLIGTVVAATFQAMTPQQSAAAPMTLTPPPLATQLPGLTLTASGSKVSGKVCYHDENMLTLTVYFQNTADNKLWTQTVSRPNDAYSLDLPAGKYQVYAWPPDYTVGVLSEGKPTVDVAAGRALTGVDLCDYSQGPFAAPYPPGVSPSKAQGSISGVISGYGGSGRLTVVAFNQGTGYWYYEILLAGQTNYTVPNLPAGRYQVVAYGDSGTSGGTQPEIYVIAGQNTTANISDWGAGYPSKPSIP